MKKRLLVMLGCALAAAALFAPASFASEPVYANRPQLDLGLIEENIVVGLQTGIPGVQADLAQLVRDLKDLYPDEELSSLTIPLMAIMHDESADMPVRMIATLALDRLSSPKGDFAIEQMARFEDHPSLKRLCIALTVRRLKGSLPPSQEIAVIEPLPEERQ
jgi:hypothetical protein